MNDFRYVEIPELRYIGKPIKRLDGIEKVTGAATFMQDMEVPGMLRGKLLYSPFAHARIRTIVTEKAERVAGISAIVTHKDLPPDLDEVSGVEPGAYIPETAVPVGLLRGWGFQYDGTVRCMGSPVAAVAGKTEEAVVQALDLIRVEYDPLPVVLDPEEAIRPGSPQVYPDIPNNQIADWKGEIGNVEKGFVDADVIYEDEGETQAQSHFTPDTRGVIAWWEAGGLVVCTAHMFPYPALLPGLAKCFALPESMVKIYGPPYMGGCYGGRAFNDVGFVLIAALLARKSGKPVKITLSREEDMMALARCETRLHARVGVRRDGTITAVDYSAHLNSGPWFYPFWALRYYTHLFKVVKCPNIRAEVKLAATNRLFGGPFRGFAYMEAFVVSQPILRKIAQDLGLDYLKLLQNTFWRGGEKVPHLPGTFLVLSASGVDEAIAKGKSLIGWDEPGEPDEHVGVGYCLAGSAQFPANVGLRLNRDGSIQLETGVIEIGAGQYTTLTYMAAEAIGVPPDVIKITRSYNTESQPWDGGQRAERTTFCTGLAIMDAASELRRKVFAVVSKKLGVSPGDLELRDGVVFSRVEPSKKLSLSAVGLPIMASGTFHPDLERIPWFAGTVVCFVRVHVDREIGQVTVRKIVMLNDVGKAINPPVVHTQNMGTLSGGLGFALTEELVYDKDGRVLNANPYHYHCPTIMDVPEFHSEIIEAKDPAGPFGAKGAGEKVLTPSVLAISAAVVDALKTILTTPITPDKVLKALGRLG